MNNFNNATWSNGLSVNMIVAAVILFILPYLTSDLQSIHYSWPHTYWRFYDYYPINTILGCMMWNVLACWFLIAHQLVFSLGGILLQWDVDLCNSNLLYSMLSMYSMLCLLVYQNIISHCLPHCHYISHTKWVIHKNLLLATSYTKLAMVHTVGVHKIPTIVKNLTFLDSPGLTTILFSLLAILRRLRIYAWTRAP